MTASKCTFIRLLADEEKGPRLRDSIRALQRRSSTRDLPHRSETFSMVPGRRSPTGSVTGSGGCSWASTLRRKREDDQTGSCHRRRFSLCRAWWEVDPARTVTGTAETTPDEFRAQTCAGKKMGAVCEGWGVFTVLCRRASRGELGERWGGVTRIPSGIHPK